MERPIRHLRGTLYPKVCEKFEARLDVRKRNSLLLEYIRERRMKSGTNEARVDCAGEWGPLSRDEFNRKFCTGFPVSISFPRARALPLHPPLPSPRLLSPLQSPNLRFSRDFSASSKMKGSLLNLFQRSSLSTETVRFPPIFGLVFFFIFLLLSFFLFLNTFCSARKNHEDGFQFLIAL